MGEENKVPVVLLSETCSNDIQTGFLPRSGAVGVSKRIGEVVVIKENGPVGSYYDRFREV